MKLSKTIQRKLDSVGLLNEDKSARLKYEDRRDKFIDNDFYNFVIDYYNRGGKGSSLFFSMNNKGATFELRRDLKKNQVKDNHKMMISIYESMARKIAKQYFDLSSPKKFHQSAVALEQETNAYFRGGFLQFMDHFNAQIKSNMDVSYFLKDNQESAIYQEDIDHVTSIDDLYF